MSKERSISGRFGDLVTAMVTPFDSNGALNLAEAEALAGWLADQGSQGLVLSGSTGEAATLSDDERAALWRTVVRAVGDRVKIIAGTGTYDTAHSIHLTEEAEKAGVDAVLVVTPYYNRPPQSGLIAHFKALAKATALPVVLYDIPIRTSRKIEHTTLMELAAVDNIVGVKDSCSDPSGAARIAADAPEGFQLYSGNDGDILPWLSIGAVGGVSTASHVVGPAMAEMIRLFKSGEAQGARKIHLDLMPVFDVMALTTNPIPLKAALEMMGHQVGAPRLPLPPATEAEKTQIKSVLQKAELI